MEDRILSQALNMKNKEELLEILNYFNIKVPKSILKKKLIEKIIETYEVEHKEFLKIFSKETQLFINRFISNNLKISESSASKKFDCIYELNYFGVINSTFDLEKEEEFFQMDKPFSEIFSADSNSASGKRELKHFDDMEKFISGVLRFYGIISEAEFKKIVLKHSLEITEEFLNIFMSKRFPLNILFPKIFNSGTNEFFYFSDFVKNPEELMRKFFLRSQLDYKILSKEEYQNFWKLDYAKETEEFSLLENFFRQHKLTKLDSRHKTLDLLLDMRSGISFGEIFQQLISDFSFDSKEESEKFTNNLQSLYNSTPQWELKGHTPEEVFNMKLDFQPIFAQRKVDKVSRNETCPCGSGKKYKKCCGK